MASAGHSGLSTGARPGWAGSVHPAGGRAVCLAALGQHPSWLPAAMGEPADRKPTHAKMPWSRDEDRERQTGMRSLHLDPDDPPASFISDFSVHMHPQTFFFFFFLHKLVQMLSHFQKVASETSQPNFPILQIWK